MWRFYFRGVQACRPDFLRPGRGVQLVGTPPFDTTHNYTESNAMKKQPPRNETTGAKAASAAGKVLADPRSSAAAKSAAASALTQVVKKK